MVCEMHLQSFLDDIFSDKLSHVRVKRLEEEEESKKNTKWLLGKAFVFSRTSLSKSMT